MIEGPSWIGYSFLSLLLIKFFSPNTKVIYHSHSIEFEVRKMMSSRLVSFLSRILEKYVFKFSDIATSVSTIEKQKIKKLYNVKVINLKNGVSRKVLNFNKRKIYSFDYIIYCGSYSYLPNKLAIDFIIDQLMPKLIKNHPKIKLILTGGGYEKKRNYLKNLGIVSKRKLLNLIYNSKVMLVPLSKGTGTRIKIIEALLVGAKIITTKKGIEGIKINNRNSKMPTITEKKNFVKEIELILKKKSAKKISNKIFNIYYMETIVKNFLKNNHVKNIIT